LIISHTHKFCFVKTRKTAGSSIEHAIAPHLKKGDWASPSAKYTPRQKALSKQFVRLLRSKQADIKARNPHLPASIIADHLQDETEGYTRFCVERNSWDKAVSAFYYWIAKHGVPKGNSDEENFANFASGRRLAFFTDFDLYTHAGYPIVDHIVPYEDLNSGLSNVTDLIGLPNLNINQVKLNSEKRPKTGRDLTRFYGSDFDNPASRRVREVFAREIEFFGYTPPTV